MPRIAIAAAAQIAGLQAELAACQKELADLRARVIAFREKWDALCDERMALEREVVIYRCQALSPDDRTAIETRLLQEMLAAGENGFTFPDYASLDAAIDGAICHTMAEEGLCVCDEEPALAFFICTITDKGRRVLLSRQAVEAPSSSL